MLPEKWPVLGTPEQTAAGAEPLDGPALTWARGDARELGIDLVAGSLAEHVEGAERGANTSVHVGPDGEDRAIYRKIHMFDVEVGGRAYRESEHEAPGDEPVSSELANGERPGPDHLLRPALPGAVPHPRDRRRHGDHRPGRVHGDDDARPLGGAPARPRDRGPVLRRRREPGRASPRRASAPAGARMIVDPWGIVLATAPDAETFVVADLDFERLRRIRAKLPSLANRQAGAYRWPSEVHA